MKVPSFPLLIFRSGYDVSVCEYFVQDLCFINLCRQARFPDLQLRLLYHEYLLAQRLLEYFLAPWLVLRLLLIYRIRCLLNQLAIALDVEVIVLYIVL